MRMHRRWWAAVFVACAAWAPVRAGEGEAAVDDRAPLYVLTIGNSFSNDATRLLPQLAEHAKTRKLVVRRWASLGGHSLKQHAGYLAAWRANPEDPKGSPYNVPEDVFGAKKTNLPAILKAEKWDVVTIQQLSSDSFRPKTYFPYAQELADGVKEFAPTAKLVLHETWAYRPDDGWLRNPKSGVVDEGAPVDVIHQPFTAEEREFLHFLPIIDVQRHLAANEFVSITGDADDLTYDEIIIPRKGQAVGAEWWRNTVHADTAIPWERMYVRIAEAYRAAAKQLDIDFFPVGTAFAAATNDPQWGLSASVEKPADPEALAPFNVGTLHVGYKKDRVKRDDGTTGWKIGYDPRHASTAGQYLGAAVWYEMILGESVVGNPYAPESLAPEKAQYLRQLAHNVVASHRAGMEAKDEAAAPAPQAAE